ncbi:NYN domain-containing protein [Vibrio sp.]|uniref:NYN domain-containing protein n=1 Tax=Vibrio viridaestus TaxID=2487322 RepID=A0A3N9TKR2_9VIBR|nr:NYN domain-containing protein [Vibrio viridaestus]MDC0609714.1 NYN domain-containing protein [Vibrio sp.]RQW64584.1 NYN domain-containing protein [Vibrio viridaestus]
MEKIVILVDVQNVYYTVKEAFQRNFDYNVFWREVTKDRQVEKAIAYAIDRGDEKQRQFQNILRAIGFDVKLKPFIQRADGSAKGDWDVGITIDALEYGREADKVILVSGDGDFGILLETLSEKYGVETEVFGVAKLTAANLINSATKYTAIDEKLLLN